MKKFMYFAAALLVLVGCNKKENAKENAPQNLVTITGGIKIASQDGPNKVVAKPGWESVEDRGDVEFIWEAGDEIAVVNSDKTEVKKFTVLEISQDKQTATFIGEPLSGGMEGYYSVYYPYEWGAAAIIDEEAEADVFANQQYSDKLRPIGRDFWATDGSFELYLYDVIDLSLTGSVKLGKIMYHIEEGGEWDTPYDITLSLGDGLQLTDQPQHVTFVPFIYLAGKEFKLSFYDTDDLFIMEKTGSIDSWNESQIFSFPTLRVFKPVK